MPKVLSATKHYQVTRQLRVDVKKLDPHDLVPTAAELVQRYDTSHSTVIRALNTLRRDGMIYRMAGQKRYQVAEFASKPLARVAIARPQYPSSVMDHVVRMIVAEGHKRQLSFEFKHFENMSALDLNRVAEESDAVVLLPSSEAIPPHIEKALNKPSKPVVLIAQPKDMPNACSVSVDDQQVGRLAVAHLQSLGHTRSMIVLDQAFDRGIEGRYEGWHGQMVEKLPKDEVRALVFDAKVKPFDDARDVTYRHFKTLLSDPRRPEFTAVFCTSDCGAAAVSRACREMGVRIPQDLSLIAYTGGSNYGDYAYPPTTTLESDSSDLGHDVCEQILVQLNNREPAQRHIKMAPVLVVRQSTDRVGQ